MRHELTDYEWRPSGRCCRTRREACLVWTIDASYGNCWVLRSGDQGAICRIAMVRVPAAITGSSGGEGPEYGAVIGRSRGGLTRKIHAVVATNGLTFRLGLTAGKAHDSRLALKLLSRLRSSLNQQSRRDVGWSSPTLRPLAGCCVCAASDQAAAVPRPASNSRRRRPVPKLRRQHLHPLKGTSIGTETNWRSAPPTSQMGVRRDKAALSSGCKSYPARNCTRDGGGPFEFGNQVSSSSHRKLLSSKATVVNIAGRDMIPAGMVERGERKRKRTAAEASK
jgi:hypothetical protein